MLHRAGCWLKLQWQEIKNHLHGIHFLISPFYSQINRKMFKLMACVSATAIKIVFAAQMKNSHIAEPNYRSLFFLIICINSKKSDTDMGNKAMKIIKMNHKYKLVVLFCKQLLFCLYSCCVPSSNYSDCRVKLHFYTPLHP